MKYLKISMVALAVLLTPMTAGAQMTSWFQWTFLPQEQMDEIIGEASGETTFNHIMEMGGGNHPRQLLKQAGLIEL
jgi:hypothetical protein